MALFGKKKTEEVSKEKAVKSAPVKAVKKSVKVVEKKDLKPIVAAPVNSNSIIIRPRITEKATLKADMDNVYVFEIAKDANKMMVSRAIEAIYKVKPLKVSVATNPSKKVFSRGKAGMVQGVKKAYVYIKKGEKIELV